MAIRKLVLSGTVLLLAVVLMVSNAIYAESGKKLITKVYHLKYESPQKACEVLEKSLPPNPERKIEIREKVSVLVITDLLENHNRIKEILNDYDKPPQQIRVEALLIAAPLTTLKELGISADLKKMPDQELRSACSKREDIKFLSSPSITVVEGVQGRIEIASPIYYMEKREDGLFEFKPYEKKGGIIFEVKATINNDNVITIDYNLEVNKFIRRIENYEEAKYLDIGWPVVNSRGSKSTIMLKDNEVVCVGGMINDRTTETVDNKTGKSLESSESIQEFTFLTAYRVNPNGTRNTDR